jgi:hypothetical protein
MNAPAHSRVRLLPVAVAAGAALVAASWAGLSRLGLALGPAPVAIHGPLMILGFLGTVISLERAVGLGKAWAWSAPLLSAAAVVLMLIGRFREGMAVLIVAGACLAVVYVVALQVGRWPAYLVVESLGTGGWLIAVGALLSDSRVVRAVPAMATFLVLTIIGERLELSRMAPGRSGTRRSLLVALAAALLAAAFIAVWAPDGGGRLAGVILILLSAVSVSGDIARRTVSMGGVAAYMAVAILAGYIWLVVAGALWASGALVPGTQLYDPAIHSLFIGFVLSMILAHAPVIVPAVARIELPFRRSWWVALVLLHVTLAARVMGTMGGALLAWRWGGVGNVAALALFVGLAAASGISAAKGTRR